MLLYSNKISRAAYCGALLTFSIANLPEAIGQEKKAPPPTRKIKEFKSTFQLSFFPGISTNGPNSASYYNTYSLNLFGGLSRGNKILELSFISNATIRSTTGIQIAGLANVVGANAFVNLTESEQHQLAREDYESNAKGIQAAGLINYVRSNASGIQLTGGLNLTGRDFQGVQISGIGNSVGGFGIGFQLAGLYNISAESFAGVQITSLFNYTDGQLSGTQISLINKARSITGKKSDPPTRARGLQIGLLNISKDMDGVQIGLINFGGTSRGKQIALINFFSTSSPSKMVRNGTPIGLLNFGSKGSYLSFSFNELFATNLEYTTGNCLNCSRVFDSEMPFNDQNQIYNQNALILGYDPIQSTWGYGYGFQKVLFNKVTMEGSPFNKTRVIVYGLKFMHLNRTLSFDPDFNLLNRLNLDYGKRWRSLYFYVGTSINYFVLNGNESLTQFNIRSITHAAGSLGDFKTYIWPGYEVGMHF